MSFRSPATSPGHGWSRVVIFLLAALHVATLLTLSWLKFEGLTNHRVDYSFHLGFASSRSNPQAVPAVNPEGRNFLGYRGVEGKDGYGTSLHVEPLKLLYRPLYRLGGVPALHLFVALLSCLPLLYLWVIRGGKESPGRPWSPALAWCYAFLPTSPAGMTYDLRPYLFLAPLFLLAVLAIRDRRPVWEAVAFFVLLLAAREEGLVLALPLILLAAAGARPPRGGLVQTFSAIWIAWALFVGLRFRQSAYAWIFPLEGIAAPSTILAFGSLALVGAGILAGLLVRKRPWWAGAAVVGTLLVPVVAQTVSFQRSFAPGGGIFGFLGQPHLHLGAVVALAALLLLVEGLPGRVSPRIVVLATVAAGLTCMAGWAAASIPIARDALERRPALRPVLELRRAEGSRLRCIVADDVTHQAFGDFPCAYNYRRLPAQLLPGPARFFPANIDTLAKLLARRADTVAVVDHSLADILPLLETGNRTVREVTRNGRITILDLSPAGGNKAGGR